MSIPDFLLKSFTQLGTVTEWDHPSGTSNRSGPLQLTTRPGGTGVSGAYHDLPAVLAPQPLAEAGSRASDNLSLPPMLTALKDPPSYHPHQPKPPTDLPGCL
jgi:hypothetical protein